MAVNWQGTLMRVLGAHEQPITVTAIEDPLPWYRRIWFSAPTFMRDLQVYPAVWVRLWVASLEDPDLMKQRGFTLVDPRPQDGTFALEFVIHEPTGPAAKWALNAAVGDEIEIAFTPTNTNPDLTLGRYVLVGDVTAIPAINSFIDALPDSTPIDVLFLDAHGDAQSLLRLQPNVTCSVFSSSREQVDALRSLDLDLADSYVWAAGERKAISAVPEVVRREWRLPKDRQHTQYYWIEGKRPVPCGRRPVRARWGQLPVLGGRPEGLSGTRFGVGVGRRGSGVHRQRSIGTSVVASLHLDFT